MDDAQSMRLGDGAGEGLDQSGRRGGRARRAVHRLLEAAAGQVFQLEERQPVRLADVIDLDDAGMLEPGDGLGLDPEPRRGRLAGVRPGQDHLQGARAVQRQVAGQVDHPHAAPAQLAE